MSDSLHGFVYPIIINDFYPISCSILFVFHIYFVDLIMSSSVLYLKEIHTKGLKN
jgi:hypothetical protein